LIIGSLPIASSSQAVYDLVILNGRVIDPESKTDAIRNLGISNGVIRAITSNKLQGLYRSPGLYRSAPAWPG
jgi:N-acyl-D-glutamate deacylase